MQETADREAARAAAFEIALKEKTQEVESIRVDGQQRQDEMSRILQSLKVRPCGCELA